MFLALREIRHQPTRFALIVAVITLVAYLTFFLAALASGLAHSYRAAVDSWHAGSVILTEASNSNISDSRLTAEQTTTALQAGRADGAQADSLIALPVVAQSGGADDGATRSDVYAFGTDLDGFLAPWVSQGEPITDPATQVLLDDSLTAAGWAVGDTLTLAGSDHEWTVVGLTHDLTFQAAPVLTVDASALVEDGPTSLSPAVNAVVSTADLAGADDGAGSSPATLTDAGLTTLTTGEFIETLPGYSAQVLTFSLMIGSLVVITAFVLGIFLYVLTLQKRPVLGVLKARGVPTRYLIASGAAQTTLLAATGVLLGLALTLLSGLALPDEVPFRLNLTLDAAITAAFILFSVLGGLISVRIVSRIDPVEAIA